MNVNLDKLFKPFPTFETARLHLRELHLSDADALFAVFSDAEAMTYYGDDVPHHSVEQTRAVIQELLDYQAGEHSVRWAITLKDEDTTIGTLGFYKFDTDSGCCEVGYELNRAYWRQGIMTEALRCVFDFMFHEAGFRRIEAGTDGDNPPSQGLLKSLGFQHEGCFRQKLYYKGQFWDENWFGLLKDDYK